MNTRFDAILVPRGAEADAVRKGVAGALRIVECAAGVHAADAAATLPRGSRIAVMGLCGALDPALRVGDVVVYERLAGPGNAGFDPGASATAHALGGRSVVGTAVERVISRAAEKRALRDRSGAGACDMEAAAVAAVARERDLTVVTIRVVSDTATNDIPNLTGAFDAEGHVRPIGLVTAFAREPVRSLSFIRDALAALRALTAVSRRVHLFAGHDGLMKP